MHGPRGAGDDHPVANVGGEAEVAVIGAGAIGGCITAYLLAAGRRDLVLCARHPLELLIVDGPHGTIRQAPRVVTRAQLLRAAPWVLVATKAHQTDGAAEWLRALTGPETTVAILQNGVEHEERVGAYADGAALLPVVVECPATRTAPGRIVQRGPAHLTVPASPRGERFALLFAGTPIAVSLTDDFVTAKWRKLCLNVAGGAISTLTDATLGVVRFPEIARLAGDLVRECIRVGRAEGAVLDDHFADEVVRSMREGPADAGTSMLTDKRAGRILESDARNGAVVRIGARHGIEAPLNRAVAALMAAINHDLPRA